MNVDLKKELKLDVLVRHDAERAVFVGQCLQFDVAVQAPSMDRLKERFAHAFAAYVMTAVQEGDPLRIRPAPRTFWDIYQTGAVNDADLPIFVPSSENQVGDVRATYRVTQRAFEQAASP